MSAGQRLILRVYRLLLACYPRAFQAEHGEEMLDVLASALAEAQGPGGQRPWRLLWREVRDWPGSVLRQRLRERRKREMASRGPRAEYQPSRLEWLAASVIFFLPSVYVVVQLLSMAGIRLPGQLAYLFLAIALLPLGWAIYRGLPRWSLPYLGFLLMLGMLVGNYDRIWRWIYPIFLDLFGPRSFWSIPIRIGYGGVHQVIYLSSILVAALILVNLLRLLPRTRGVWQRIRSDWTQLSFLLYGGLVFGIVEVFDEYDHRVVWQCAAWGCLALGAWFYLRAGTQKRRILGLVGAAAGAMWIVALAKWLLIPLQAWPAGYPVSPSEVSRLTETGGALVSSVLIVLMLLAPALLDLLPRAPGPVVHSDTRPVAV